MPEPRRSAGARSSIELFRDCLRLVRHVAADSPKGVKLRQIVCGEFRKNKNETDPKKIEALRGNAIRALTNYLTYEGLGKELAKKKAEEAKKAREKVEAKVDAKVLEAKVEAKVEEKVEAKESERQNVV